MLNVPCRQRKLRHAVDLRLTVSRISDGAVEVAISTPGRLKAIQPGCNSKVTARKAKPGDTTRLPKVDKKKGLGR